MIKTLHDKFEGLVIDFKVILKEKEVIVFLMPGFEDKKNLEPMKFRGTPENIEKQIVDVLNGISDTDISEISNYDSLLKTIEKASKATIKKTTKASTPKAKEEKTSPSLF